MTKKEQELQVAKGTRITGKKASAESYMPLYEFLIFDPTYRKMKEKAKILYSWLRKKTADNEKKYKDYMESLENGETPSKGTESYLDKNGEIFCLADNAELSIILQCHPNRVKDQRDELKRYGLLEEVPRFNDAGHKLSSAWYVLEPNPETLSERWAYIEEVKELRETLKEENQKKKDKHLAKKKAESKIKEETEAQKGAEKIPQEAYSDKDSETNQQNVSWPNQQNVSWSNQQNVSKSKSKGSKSNLNSLNNTLNLSIKEEIKNTSLPKHIKKSLSSKIDRLIEFKINVFDIELHFHAVHEKFNEQEYAFVLNNLLDKMTTKPQIFAAVMNDWLDRNRKKQNQFAEKKKNNTTAIRTEKLPDWFEEETNNDEVKVVESISKDQTAKKQEIEDMLKRLRA